MFLFPFRQSFDDGTTINGMVIMSPGLTTITGTLSDPVDGVNSRFNLSITDELFSTNYFGEISVEIKNLGTADITLNIYHTIFGDNLNLVILADFEPEDLIEWICIDPSDTDIRDRLLQHLPALQMIWMFGHNFSFSSGVDLDGEEDDGKDWDLDAFQDFEVDPFKTEEVPDDLGDPPLNTMRLDQPYTGGRSSWLQAIDPDGELGLYEVDPVFGRFEDAAPKLDPLRDQYGDWDEQAPMVTALVHIPGFGFSGRVEVIRYHLGVDQIVEQALGL